MYKVKAMLKELWFNGNRIRSRKPLTSPDLKTKEGLHRWLREQAPFEALTIYQDGEDITEEFLG
jgi:hypothetical protein